MGASQHTGGHSNILGYPNLWRHPNVWGIWTTPEFDKACFLCVAYVQGAPLCLDAPWICVDTPMFGCPHMFGCPLYIHNTRKACFVTLRVVHMPHVWMPSYVWMAPCMFECPHMFGQYPYVCFPLYVWTPPVCFDAPLYVWMPTVHTQHKESMLCHTKGFPYVSYVWTPPVCLDGPLYVWMPPYVWMHPCMFGWPHVWMFGHHLYVWMPPIHTQHKASMLCHTKGVSICPIHLDTPICVATILEFLPFCFFNSNILSIFQNIPLCWMPPYV